MGLLKLQLHSQLKSLGNFQEVVALTYSQPVFLLWKCPCFISSLASRPDLPKAARYVSPLPKPLPYALPSFLHLYIFPAAVQWGEDRRPFHFMFYTGKQSYYSLMHVSSSRGHCGLNQRLTCWAKCMCICMCVSIQEIHGKLLSVEKHQDHLRFKGLLSSEVKTMWVWKLATP